MDTTREARRSRHRSAVTVALEPHEIRALLVAAHMTMDTVRADDEAALESAAARLLAALRASTP